ncbi:hypothetical protein J8F10_23405 [Gemmata sp. G18]|uniref:Lipoprotein n=1 Tax=Gemmata palustris TaxID=2822762 RepID=A0ABS5BWT6_9BACT|nr:hypothetical protein [Gemmata palustris]MBP3958207.1 hypothetical protein [Gemmata palustris]
MKYSRVLKVCCLVATVLAAAQGCGKSDKAEPPKQFIPPPGPDMKPQAGGAGTGGPATPAPPPPPPPK